LTQINEGLEDCLYMGNLDSLRDWGHARDYVEMLWRMLQQDSPEDFVIGTGTDLSIWELAEAVVHATSYRGSIAGISVNPTALRRSGWIQVGSKQWAGDLLSL
jgi:GDPmannose 4,6-dehydratase